MSDLRKKVIITQEVVRVVTVGIQGPAGAPGANSSFNDSEGSPTSVGTSPAATGNSSYAARRDHKHALNTSETDTRYVKRSNNLSDLADAATARTNLAAASSVHAHVESDVVGLPADLAGKETAVTPGTSGQYYRGDKTWQTLNKAAVGLPNADNTSDANKPVSTAAQTALDAKQPLDSDLTAIGELSPAEDDFIQRKAGAWVNRTPAQVKTDLGLTKADVGLSNVPNTDATSRANHTGTQTASTISDFNTVADARISDQKAAPNGLATLGADSKIPSSQLPALAITNTFVVASQAAMLALSADPGDVAVRTDLEKSYILTASPASTLGNWQELINSGNVVSVNGQTGAVSLVASDVGAQAVDSDLTALAGLSATGIIARTGSGTMAARTIAVGSSKLSVTNGDGVSGNPTLDVVESALTLVNLGGTLSVAKGGTGATSASAARTNLGVDTTSNIAEGSNLYYTDARVRANRLDQLSAPTTDVSMGSQRITGLTDPLTAQDAATKNYVDTAAQPLDATLTALAALNNTAGLLEQTGADTFTRRAIGVAASTSIPTRADADARYALTGRGLPTGGTSGQVLAKSSSTDYDAGWRDVPLSVNGHTGVVVLVTSDIAEGTNLYYTDTRADARITAQKGSALGLATLDSGGKVPAAQLPSYVDDALEYANLAAFPGTGATGVIYVALDSNKTYRWSGSTYVEISPSEVTSVNGHSGAVVLTATDFGGLLAANNLSDVASSTTARTNLGLGSMAVQAASSVAITGGTITGITDLAVADGGTGAGTASGARTNLGLVIGTDVLAPTGSGASLTGVLKPSNNLSDVSNASTAFTNIKQNATTSSTGVIQLAGDLGGTAASPRSKDRVVTFTVGPSGSTADYVCDGTADDVELNAALAATGTAGGGKVLVRAGTYNLVAGLLIPNNVILAGEGIATHLKNATNSSINLINNSDQTLGNSNIGLADLMLDGDKTNWTGSQNGLFFKLVTDSFIENVYVANFRVTGVNIQTSSRVVIRNSTSTGNTSIGILFTIGCTGCVAENCRTFSNTSFGMQFKDADYCSMNACVSHNNGEHGFYIFDSAAAGTGSNNSMKGCISYSNSKHGFYINAGTKNVLSGNTAYGNTWSGISMDSGANNTDVTSNTCTGNLIHGIALNGSGHSVTGNVCTANQQHGISLAGTINSSITGNTSYNNGQLVAGSYDGINITTDGTTASSGNTITGNVTGDDQGTPTQRYGVNEVSGNASSNNFANNLASGNATGSFNITSATSLIYHSDIVLPASGARSIAIARVTAAATAGNNLTLSAGSAVSGGTNLAGGNMVLQAGIGTGSASSSRLIVNLSPTGSTGTSDNAVTTSLILLKSSNTAGLGVQLILNNTTTGATNGINLSGQGTQTIGMVRHITTNTAGNSLTLVSGGATSGATDKASGNLVLQTGLSTGTGGGQVIIKTPTPAASTGTADNSTDNRLVIDSTAIAAVTPLTVTTSGVVATDPSLGGSLRIDNTASTGLGLSIYTNVGSGALAPLAYIKSANSSFSRYTLQVESNTTSLTADTLRVTAKAGARGIFIEQLVDAGSLIIDASAAPNSVSGSNQTVFAIQGNNNAFSMAKFVNQATSISNNSNVFIQNTSATTTARTLQLDQQGSGTAFYADSASTTNPAIEVNTSTYGIKVTSTNYGLRLVSGDMQFGGASARQILVDRAASGAGAGLTIQAGGAQSGATSTAGGTLTLSGGIATGSNAGRVVIATSGGGSPGTTDSNPATTVTFSGGSTAPAVIIGGAVTTAQPGYNVTGQLDMNLFQQRNITSNFAGKSLTVTSAGATVGATDKAAGDLVLRTGVSTGTGTSQILLQTADVGSSGTTDNSLATRLTITAAALISSAPLNMGSHLITNVTDPGSAQDAATKNYVDLADAGKQPLDATLTALAAFSTNGLLTQTAADTFTGRTITASTGISVANGDGVNGNPTITNTGVTSITGTTNQVTASASTGGVTLSLPQSIHSGASPSFTGLTLSGNQTTAGYLRIGSNSAPANTTAGDLTAVRLNLGNGSFSTTESPVNVTGTMTTTSSTSPAFANFQNTITPTGNSATNFRALQFANIVNPATGIAFTGLAGIQSVYLENRVRSDGSIGSLIGANINPFIVDSSSAATATATLVTGIQINAIGRPSGTTAPTITTVLGYDFQMVAAGLTSTTVTGYRMTNPGANTITNLIGADIAALTRGSALNIGLRIAAPSGATANYALQLSDTGGTTAGGITFGTDTTLYRSAADTLKTDDLFISAGHTINANKLNVSTAKTPASASDTGTTGDIAWDSGFVYVCTATNTWKRAAIATW